MQRFLKKYIESQMCSTGANIRVMWDITFSINSNWEQLLVLLTHASELDFWHLLAWNCYFSNPSGSNGARLAPSTNAMAFLGAHVLQTTLMWIAICCLSNANLNWIPKTTTKLQNSKIPSRRSSRNLHGPSRYHAKLQCTILLHGGLHVTFTALLNISN